MKLSSKGDKVAWGNASAVGNLIKNVNSKIDDNPNNHAKLNRRGDTNKSFPVSSGDADGNLLLQIFSQNQIILQQIAQNQALILNHLNIENSNNVGNISVLESISGNNLNSFCCSKAVVLSINDVDPSSFLKDDESEPALAPVLKDDDGDVVFASITPQMDHDEFTENVENLKAKAMEMSLPNSPDNENFNKCTFDNFNWSQIDDEVTDKKVNLENIFSTTLIEHEKSLQAKCGRPLPLCSAPLPNKRAKLNHMEKSLLS